MTISDERLAELIAAQERRIGSRGAGRDVLMALQELARWRGMAANDAVVDAVTQAVDALDWSQTEFGEVPHERDIARAALAAAVEAIKGQGGE